MRKFLKIAGIAVALLILAVFVFREPLKEGLYAWATRDMFVAADDDSFDPGPAVGTRFPPIRATYQDSEITDISRFAGENGTMFIASRSMDWCPFCMKQMVQLQANKAAFDAAGIGLVAITYDTPELQQPFIDRHGITIPLLSDIETQSFTALGILNEQYEPGEMAYGIPHPGMIVVDHSGRIVGKMFIEAYSTRVDSAAALQFARQWLGFE